MAGRRTEVREISFAGTEIMHPETLPDGRGLWIAPEVRDILRRLRFGDPGMGWAGDPRLALYRDERARHWELWRLEADGQYRMVLKSKPGVNLDGLIKFLVEHDTQRGYDAVQRILEHNKANYRKNDLANAERMDAAMDHVIWGLRKDLGEGPKTVSFAD
jgi:hypothetical protein